ncbi:MAG: GntR family transcriptional regulator [Sporolactobacillus sp.]
MQLTIDFGSDRPIYQQIRDAIVTGVATGDLTDGESLPSVRALTMEIGVNLHTVNKAYRLLQSEGFIEIQRSRGTRIKAGNAARDAAFFLETTSEAMHTLVSEAITRRVDRAVLHRMIDNLYDELEGNHK